MQTKGLQEQEKTAIAEEEGDIEKQMRDQDHRGCFAPR